MTLSMYQASVPVFIRQLENLAHILAKGAAYAETRKIDPAVFLQARLAPDMFPLPKQVQIAADMAKSGSARLAGVELPKYDDNETTFPELQARIEKTLAFVKGFKPEQIDGSENREVTLKIAGDPITFKGEAYLLHFVLPNLYFHNAMAYAILRHNGVELGKLDFLGKPL